MSRMLGFYPLITSIITVALILALCLFNMFLLVRHKRSHITSSIHIISLFTILAFIFHMISAAVFVHSLSYLYRQMARIFVLLAGLSILGAIVSTLLLRQKHSIKNFPYNISDALSSIEDLVFVVDRDGAVTNINHPEKYQDFFGDIGTMERLLFFIRGECCETNKAFEKLDDLSDAAACEIYFKHANTHSNLKISPIIIGNARLGYTAVLEDISAIRESEKILREQNESLKRANARLSNYIKAAGVLEAEKERLQILEQVQNTLIQDIEKALSSIRSVQQRCFEDGTYQAAMKELAAQLRQIYQKVRNAVGQIAEKVVKT